MLLTQAVSRQEKKSETQTAAKAQQQQQPKIITPNGKASSKPQKGQQLSPSQANSTKSGTELVPAQGESKQASGQSPYVSSVSDVKRSLQSTSANKETKQPEIATKAGEEAKKTTPGHPKVAGMAPSPTGAEMPSAVTPAQKGAGDSGGAAAAAPSKESKKGSANEKEKEQEAKKGGSAAKASGAEKVPPTAAPADKAGPKGEKSPKTPEEDPAFQAVAKKAKGVARQQAHHEPAKAKAAQAQAAAKGPPNEVQSQAKSAQVEKMDAQEPGHFDKESFKAALLAKIASVAPKNLEEADDFKEDNKAATIKDSVTAEVKQGKESAQGAIKQTTGQPPEPGSAKPKEVLELKPSETGPPPPKIGAQLAAPKPKTESEISLKEGSQSLDNQMQEAEVTDDQLSSSNEPQFQDALKSKKDAQQHAAEAPGVYRQQEQGILATAQKEASSLGQTQLQAMHQERQGVFKKVGTEQTSAKSVDEQKRAEVSTKIETIYNTTKQKVEARLSKLDDEVNAVFDGGLEQATREFEDYVDRRMSAYKEDRYSGALGKLDWASDKLFGMPDEVNVFYEEGRSQYINKMNAIIDSVATIVETGLNEAKEMIAAGRQEVKTYVEGLPKDLKDVGKQAEENIESKFDELNQSLEEKQSQLVDSLSQKYVDNLNKVDERINEMKAENKGLVDKAKDAIVGAIKTILKLKDMLLGVLAKVASVVTKIIKHPIDFLGNLVKGVKAGLDNFMGKIGDYLQQGMFEWLFGEMTKTGIQMPKAFDFKGILSLVLQVLGLTYPAIRGRAVKLLGEGVVKGLEGASEIFMTLISEGPAGLWKYIQEKIADLKETVIEGIKGFLKEKIIIAGITWIVGLLNPASAFIKAAKAIYDIVMFFVTRGSQVMSLVDAIMDSMAAIADGGIGVAAAAVEKALGKAVPVVIGFLASLLGLGGIGEKIRGIINKVQAPINKAVDWVIQKAASMAKSAGKFVAQAGVPQDPKERLMLAGKASVYAVRGLSGSVTRPALSVTLSAIGARYGLQSIEPHVQNGTWWVRMKINPADDVDTGRKEKEDVSFLRKPHDILRSSVERLRKLWNQGKIRKALLANLDKKAQLESEKAAMDAALDSTTAPEIEYQKLMEGKESTMKAEDLKIMYDSLGHRAVALETALSDLAKGPKELANEEKELRVKILAARDRARKVLDNPKTSAILALPTYTAEKDELLAELADVESRISADQSTPKTLDALRADSAVANKLRSDAERAAKKSANIDKEVHRWIQKIDNIFMNNTTDAEVAEVPPGTTEAAAIKEAETGQPTKGRWHGPKCRTEAEGLVEAINALRELRTQASDSDLKGQIDAAIAKGEERKQGLESGWKAWERSPFRHLAK